MFSHTHDTTVLEQHCRNTVGLSTGPLPLQNNFLPFATLTVIFLIIAHYRNK